jgi:hypothetical protein
VNSAVSSARARLLAPIVAVITFLVFLPALGGEFLNWDDDKNFLTNENYRGLGWPEMQWMWTSHHMGRYIPITWMTLGLDFNVYGMEPFGYHLTSLLWHCANAVVLYFVALSLFRIATSPDSPVYSRLPLAACFTALVFAVHPLRAESVAWVTERRDVVSGFFYLFAILLYLRAQTDPRRWKYYWASVGSFVIAVLSKEMAVTLPVVLLILDVYPLRRLSRSALMEKVPYLLVSVADSAVAFYLGRLDRFTMSIASIGWFQRLAISVYGFAFYLWKTIVPLHLGAFYALTPHRVDPRGLPFLASAGALLFVATAVLLFRKKFPVVPGATLAYAIALLPVAGFFQNGLQIAADRYTYLPCLGFAVVAGAGLLMALRYGPPAVILTLAAIIVITLGTLTWKQVETWHDSDALWTHALEVEPSYLAYTSKGAILSEKGDTIGAIEHFRKAIEMRPEYWPAHFNLGVCLGKLDRWPEAVDELRIALHLESGSRDDATLHYTLGYSLMQVHNVDEAIGHFREALRLYPDFDKARNELAAALAKKNGQPAAPDK